MATTKKKTIKKVQEITFDLYPSPDLHTNHFQLGFDKLDVLSENYSQKTSKVEYFNYMIKLLGGEKNVKEIEYNDDTKYWEVTLNNVMNMYKAEEALKEIERIEPYIDPTTKVQEERNYFLFREPFAGECRVYANLLQGQNEGIAVLKTEKDFAELMLEWKKYFDGAKLEGNQIQ